MGTKSLFLHYYDLTHQLTRFKNKLKGYFRQVGIKTPGSGIYQKKGRVEWVKNLVRYPHLLTQATHTYPILDGFDVLRNDTRSLMIKKVRVKSPLKVLNFKN